MRLWQITAVADHGIHFNTTIEAETALAALEEGMAYVRTAVAPDPAPDFFRIEVKEVDRK